MSQSERLIFTRPRWLVLLRSSLLAVCVVLALVAVVLLLMRYVFVMPYPVQSKAVCERPLHAGEHKFRLIVIDGRVILRCQRRV